MSDIINDAKGVASTFTSWDSCMSKTYCKWPVIAAIIIGSLIVLSILWCIFSCLCCGISLMTACGKCLTCGGCCGACRSNGRRKDPEYHPMPPTPTPYQGYQPPAQPMMYNGPQFATFDTGNKSAPIHEDSLPAMPSWENAQTRRVERTSLPPPARDDNMEMQRMLPQSPAREHYNSDLGAQPLHHQNTGHNDYYNDSPLSPAPTYRTTATPLGAGAYGQSHNDRFSPQAQQQHNRFSPQPQHNFNNSYTGAAPYPASRESVQYGVQRSMSPPGAPSYTSYNSTAYEPQDQGTRPPSLLQVGRKPLAGSYREV